MTLNINIKDYIPKHKYIRLYDNEENYKADVDAKDMHECAYSLVNRGNLVEKLEYQPSHRKNEYKDNEKLLPYFSEDVIKLWAGLKIIWGYFGWEEKKYNFNTVDEEGNSVTEELLGGQFYVVKPMTILKTVPDLWQYQHLVDFLKNVDTVDTYEEQDFSTIKVAGHLVNIPINGKVKEIIIPECYTDLDNLELITSALYNYNKTPTILFETDVIKLNGIKSLVPFPINDINNLPKFPQIAINSCRTIGDTFWTYESKYITNYVKSDELKVINELHAFINCHNIKALGTILSLSAKENIDYKIDDNFLSFIDDEYTATSLLSINNYYDINININRELHANVHPPYYGTNNFLHLEAKNNKNINITKLITKGTITGLSGGSGIVGSKISCNIINIEDFTYSLGGYANNAEVIFICEELNINKLDITLSYANLRLNTKQLNVLENSELLIQGNPSAIYFGERSYLTTLNVDKIKMNISSYPEFHFCNCQINNPLLFDININSNITSTYRTLSINYYDLFVPIVNSIFKEAVHLNLALNNTTNDANINLNNDYDYVLKQFKLEAENSTGNIDLNINYNNSIINDVTLNFKNTQCNINVNINSIADDCTFNLTYNGKYNPNNKIIIPNKSLYNLTLNVNINYEEDLDSYNYLVRKEFTINKNVSVNSNERKDLKFNLIGEICTAVIYGNENYKRDLTVSTNNINHILNLTLTLNNFDFFKLNEDRSDIELVYLKKITRAKVKKLDLTNIHILMPDKTPLTFSFSGNEPSQLKLKYFVAEVNYNDLVDELDFDYVHATVLGNLDNPYLGTEEEHKDPLLYNNLTLNRNLYNKFTDAEKEQMITCWKSINIRENLT